MTTDQVNDYRHKQLGAASIQGVALTTRATSLEKFATMCRKEVLVAVISGTRMRNLCSCNRGEIAAFLLRSQVSPPMTVLM